jgi:hypothetical protein
LIVIADIMKKTYETGKEVAKDFMNHLKVKVSGSLPKLNYIISPMEISDM